MTASLELRFEGWTTGRFGERVTEFFDPDAAFGRFCDTAAISIVEPRDGLACRAGAELRFCESPGTKLSPREPEDADCRGALREALLARGALCRDTEDFEALDRELERDGADLALL